MIGDTIIKINKTIRKQNLILKMVIVNHAFQEQSTFVTNKLHRSQLLKAMSL